MKNDDTFGNVIYSYSRSQAIEDGVLIDLSKFSLIKEAGISVPFATTSSVFNILNPSEKLMKLGQSLEGRLCDLLTILILEIKKSKKASDRVYFSPLFIKEESSQPVPVKMWAHIGPGDNMEPVMTIMLEGED